MKAEIISKTTIDGVTKYRVQVKVPMFYRQRQGFSARAEKKIPSGAVTWLASVDKDNFVTFSGSYAPGGGNEKWLTRKAAEKLLQAVSKMDIPAIDTTTSDY